MADETKLGVRELAAELGLSFSTVAAALRGSPLVGAATRKRVLGHAARRGYRRDSAAAMLAARRGSIREGLNIAYLQLKQSPLREVRLKLLSGAAADRGYAVTEFCADDVPGLRRAGRTLYHRGAEAIVLGRMPLAAARAVGLQNFCVVSDDHTMFEHGIDVVRGDHLEGVCRLLRAIGQRGYRRPGVILRWHKPVHPDDVSREAAVLSARHHQDEYGFEDIAVLNWPTGRADEHLTHGRELRQWIEAHRLDVVVGLNGFEEWLLAAIGLERLPFAAMSVQPEFTGRLFGLSLDQSEMLPPLLDRLEVKLRLGLRGLHHAPVETVIRLPLLPGSSLPPVRRRRRS